MRRGDADLRPGSPGGGLARGATVAGYRIRRELDLPGGSYVAYEAVKASRSGSVVLKLMDERLNRDERFVGRLEQDLAKQAALSHAAIVPVLDYGRAEQGLYVVTALVGRPTLAQVLAERGRGLEYGGLKPPRALRVLGQIADVLEPAHAAGLVHGCLQTHCIRVGPRDRAFVDDFGLSRLGVGDDPYTGPPLASGAPEQFAGEPATPRSDVYGLAAVAYECLTGAAPYWHGAFSHDGKPPLPMARHSRELPPELDAPLARALAEDPEERQATVSELIGDLSGALVLWSGESARRAAGGRGAAPSPVERHREQDEDAPADVAVWNDRPNLPATSRESRPAPAAASRRAAPRRLRLLAGATILAAAAAAAAAAGVVIGGRDAPKAPTPVSSTVASGLVELTAPARWRRGTDAGFAGLFEQRPIALAAPGGPAAVRLVAGTVRAEGPTFVPEPVVATLAEGLPRPDVVALNGARALRYSALRPRDSSRIATLYSVPTSAGVALISCSAPAGASAVEQLGRCERIAATLRIRGGRPADLTVSARYGKVLTGVLTRINAVRERQRENLRHRGRQAAAARSLALAYAQAGRTLAAADPPAAAELHAAIRRAFRRTRQAYAELATAARRNDRVTYERARGAVVDGERDIQAALKSLNTLGYAPA